MGESSNLDVFGAGMGLGASVAHRFGREGFRVALVGRRQHRLDEVATGLRAAGIDCAPFAANLSHLDVAPELVRKIKADFGEIDVLHYGPLAGDQQFYPASTLDVPTQQDLLDLFCLTPMALLAEILPAMMTRRQGAILVTQGLTALDPIPGLSGVGPAMAAMHNFIRSLGGEVAEQGIYAGTVTLRAGIRGSEMYMRLQPGGDDRPSVPSVDADDVADLLWTMFVHRDQPAAEYPAGRGASST